MFVCLLSSLSYHIVNLLLMFHDNPRSLEGSIAPTPATSPERGGSPSKASHDDQDDEGSVINQQPSVEEDGIVEKVDQMALSEAPDQSPGMSGRSVACSMDVILVYGDSQISNLGRFFLRELLKKLQLLTFGPLFSYTK